MSLVVNIVRDSAGSDTVYEDALRRAIASIKDHEALQECPSGPSRLIVRNTSGLPLFELSLRLNMNDASWCHPL